jgi:hypothetical protein
MAWLGVASGVYRLRKILRNPFLVGPLTPTLQKLE